MRSAFAVAFAVLAAVLGLAGSASGALDEAEKRTLLRDGDDLFRQANDTVGKDPDAARDLYGKAIMRFERIAGEGEVHNGPLFYNIGNAYFRMEDIGRAVLNYRRALLYSPNDANLRQNLDYARTKCLDKIDVRQKTKIMNTLFFWHYDLSSRTRTVIFVLFSVLLWFFAAVRILVRKPWTGWMLGFCGCVAVLFMLSIAAEAYAAHTQKTGVVVGREVIARKGDSDTYEPSFTEPLHAGTEFDVVEQRPDWYQVELVDGRRCWVPVKSVELVQ
ncbi:MAG: tetratricopeptide repeat protein [bacterium]